MSEPLGSPAVRRLDNSYRSCDSSARGERHSSYRSLLSNTSSPLGHGVSSSNHNTIDELDLADFDEELLDWTLPPRQIPTRQNSKTRVRPLAAESFKVSAPPGKSLVIDLGDSSEGEDSVSSEELTEETFRSLQGYPPFDPEFSVRLLVDGAHGSKIEARASPQACTKDGSPATPSIADLRMKRLQHFGNQGAKMHRRADPAPSLTGIEEPIAPGSSMSVQNAGKHQGAVYIDLTDD